jgi:hypothetical protein
MPLLRSFDFMVSGFYKDAAPTALKNPVRVVRVVRGSKN